jgi:hypothetical protein
MKAMAKLLEALTLTERRARPGIGHTVSSTTVRCSTALRRTSDASIMSAQNMSEATPRTSAEVGGVWPVALCAIENA